MYRFHEFTNNFIHFDEFTNEKKPIPAYTNAPGGSSQYPKFMLGMKYIPTGSYRYEADQ